MIQFIRFHYNFMAIEGIGIGIRIRPPAPSQPSLTIWFRNILHRERWQYNRKRLLVIPDNKHRIISGWVLGFIIMDNALCLVMGQYQVSRDHFWSTTL